MDKLFNGFPRNSESIPIPSLFFTYLMPRIQDINELKTALQVFWIIRRKKDFPRFVSKEELAADKSFTAGLMKSVENSSEADIIQQCLDSMVKKDLLLKAKIKENVESRDIFFLNMEPDRTYLRKILDGQIKMPDLSIEKEDSSSDVELQENIYTIYEKNIGMITPMIAEEIKKAEEIYPKDWLIDAVKVAVSSNKRNWRYVTAILERWLSEGRSNGETGRHSKKERDRDRFVKGRYGHLVNR